MKYYNKNQIISISLLDEEESKNIKYFEEEKGIFGLFKKDAGLYQYSKYRHDYVIKLNKIPDNCYDKNGIIFVKPRIHIEYINDSHTIYFDSNKQRDVYFKRNFNDLNLTTQ